MKDSTRRSQRQEFFATLCLLKIYVSLEETLLTNYCCHDWFDTVSYAMEYIIFFSTWLDKGRQAIRKKTEKEKKKKDQKR